MQKAMTEHGILMEKEDRACQAQASFHGSLLITSAMLKCYRGSKQLPAGHKDSFFFLAANQQITI